MIKINIPPRRHLWNPPRDLGDRRWNENPPNKPLCCILVTSPIFILISITTWISYAASKAEGGEMDPITAIMGIFYPIIGLAFTIAAAIDLTMFFKHRLRPLYAVSIVPFWTLGWLSLFAMGLLFFVFILEYRDYMQLTPGEMWREFATPLVYCTCSCMNCGFYIWYLVQAVRTFKLQKTALKQSVELHEHGSTTQFARSV